MKILTGLFLLLMAGSALPQQIQPGPKGVKINAKDAARYAGRLVWVALPSYQATDDGRMLFMRTGNAANKHSVVVIMSGAARKKWLSDMAAIRELNQKVKSAYDTTVNANGRVIYYKGSPAILVGRAAHMFLGRELELEQPSK